VAEQTNPESSISPRPFDVNIVAYLVKLMGENELTELHLEEGEQVIRLRRGPKHVPILPQALPVSPAPIPVPTPTANANTNSTPAAAEVKSAFIEIKSPTPGTFYSASGPDAEPFVKVGSKVKPDTIVCIIEAMKVFNEIPAEVSGTVAAIKVDDKQPVEYGQVLFHIVPD
jgi:acetyl-CoA carboxylase biotin carboxyl carrier protein